MYHMLLVWLMSGGEIRGKVREKTNSHYHCVRFEVG